MASSIIGNWKMNGHSALVAEMVGQLKNLVNQVGEGVQVVICPPFPYLDLLQKTVGDAPIGIGAQNVHPEPGGAFTGEVSVTMLQEWGVTHCIVGHSERRLYFGETDDLVNQKVKILLAQHIQPILCVGESLAQREAGIQEATVIGQLGAALQGISSEELSKCIIAYEPIWAIGTGKTATAQQANQMHSTIRHKLAQLSSDEIARAMPVVYGGSVNPKNSGELLQQSEIDGSLVGGASLKPQDFCQIIQSSQ